MKLTPAQIAKLGGRIAQAAAIPIPPGSHEGVVRTYSDEMLTRLIDDIGKRNLSDLRDHETRWLAERSKAARAERRRRKALPVPA